MNEQKNNFYTDMEKAIENIDKTDVSRLVTRIKLYITHNEECIRESKFDSYYVRGKIVAYLNIVKEIESGEFNPELD